MVHKDSQIRKRVADSGEGSQPDKQVISGMKNPERTQILVLLGERAACAREIADELDLPKHKVSYELKALKKLKLVKVSGEKKVRGVYERYYVAVKTTYLNPSEWPNIPDGVKGKMRGSLLSLLVNDAVAAVAADTYDSMPNAHMSWMPMLLDEQGWHEVIDLLLEAMERVLRIKAKSKERLNGSPGISCTISMLGYPSANEDRQVGLPPSARAC